jgi:RNA-directed DNA polymerase
MPQETPSNGGVSSVQGPVGPRRRVAEMQAELHRWAAADPGRRFDDLMKAMGAEIRSWRLSRRSDKSLDDLARMFNSIVQGWINYYGRFYKSRLLYFLRRLNNHLVRWAGRKYKRLNRRERRAMAWLAEIARRSPRLFAHWRLGARPDGWAMGAG